MSLYPCRRKLTHNHLKCWEIIADNLKNTLQLGAGFQPLMVKAERSGLLTHTAMTENAS
jgi:hypothetical protein